MVAMRVRLRSVPGTGAAIGWAGAHTVLIDRPEGRAGGTGLGFNGGEMLALAIGGCLCNDLRYTAEKRSIAIASLAVDVTLTLAGEPLVATEADVAIAVSATDETADMDDLIAAAVAVSTVSNSVRRGMIVRTKRTA
jgi:organic hydroperoxide reductase OsmC/OhrA